MAYKISYGTGDIKTAGKKHTVAWIAAGILALALGLRVFWPSGIARVWDILLPMASESQAAFSDMLAQIQAGENVGDAVTAFCQEVIAQAELPDES